MQKTECFYTLKFMLIYNTTYHVALDDARNFVIWLNECYIPEAEKSGELKKPSSIRAMLRGVPQLAYWL